MTAPEIVDVPDYQLANCNDDWPAFITTDWTDNCSAGGVGIQSDGGVDDGVSADGCIQYRLYTFTITDDCGNSDTETTRVSREYDMTVPTFDCPSDIDVFECDGLPNIELPIADDNCDANVEVVAVRSDGLALSDPFPIDQVVTVTLTAQDQCGNAADECEFTVIVRSCGAPQCTYTQGFYGNVGGTACLPDGTTTSAQGIMINALTNAGGVVYFGSMISGNYFELKLSDINGNPTPGQNNIFKMLPGGGTPRALIDYATYDIFATWSDNDPLYASGKKIGAINNNLLSQTMTLFFNMDIASDLALIDLEPVFATADVNCGSDVVIPDTTQIFNIPQSVIDYLNNNGGATVGNLYLLANEALAGNNIGGLSHSDINAAVDAINRGYDACRIKVAVPVDPEPEPLNIASADFNIYPVPFNNDITIQYLFKYSSPVEIQIFDAKGALVMTEKDPDAYFNKEIKLRLSFSHGKGEMFFVKLITKTGVSIKKIISTNK